jgi:hypothetical protein
MNRRDFLRGVFAVAATAVLGAFAGVAPETPYASMVPSGRLSCNGAAVLRAKYARLFAVIGTVYGDGDGRTTFNLPCANGFLVDAATNPGFVIQASARLLVER